MSESEDQKRLLCVREDFERFFPLETEAQRSLQKRFRWALYLLETLLEKEGRFQCPNCTCLLCRGPR